MRRRSGIIAVGLLVVSALMSGIATAHDKVGPDEHDGGATPGLGTYGQTGQIERSELSLGHDLTINDTALELANEPIFADARAAWDESIDFVDQIDYQLEFREAFDYLSSDPAHIAQLLEDKPRNVGYDELQLFLTDEEASEFERRMALGDRMDDVLGVLTPGQPHPSDYREGEPIPYPDWFGGIWMDQLDGGSVVLSATRPLTDSELEAVHTVVPEQHLKVLLRAYSLDDLYKVRDNVHSVDSESVVSLEFESDGVRMLIQTDDPAALMPVVGDLPQGAVEFQTPNFGGINAPGALHSFADQQPGIFVRFKVPAGSQDGYNYCTWGHNGHTDSYNYIVTSAHCFENGYDNHAGSVTGGKAYQAGNESRNVAATNPLPRRQEIQHKGLCQISVRLRRRQLLSHGDCHVDALPVSHE